MSRLYALVATATEIADHFGAGGDVDIAVPSETIEECPGLVVREANGRRMLGQMLWGFPRLKREMRLRGEPPGSIGLAADQTNRSEEKTAELPSLMHNSSAGFCL